MSPAAALAWWVILAALLVVIALSGWQLLRAYRELERIAQRVEAYADLPVVAALERAERDADRLTADLSQVEPLLERATAALAVIRRGPVPPELHGAFRGLRTAAGVAIRLAGSRR